MVFENCVVLVGPELSPMRCRRFAVQHDTIEAIDCIEQVVSIESGTRVIIPGLYNSHTHIGDACVPDGATGLSLEEGFFRPHGLKYRELAKLSPEEQQQSMCETLRYMSRTGTVCHLDFREQARLGAELLRAASKTTGVESIILSQIDSVPYDVEELRENTQGMTPELSQEIEDILAVSDGLSESTMNEFTDHAWRTVYQMTKERGKLRAIHCLENEDYRKNSQRMSGVGDLARAINILKPHIIAHMTVANTREIAALADSGITGVLNPRANANLGLPLPPISSLIKSNTNLLLGTDNGMLNSPNMFAELDFTYKVAKSQGRDPKFPDPVRVLKMATSNIRKALGGDHYGSLEKGLPASFVVLDFHKPHLSRSRHIHASITTRVTPNDIIATYRLGRKL
ncbi:MAG: amidohydrolase family protein [Verrucomicrobiota bacterium]